MCSVAAVVIMIVECSKKFEGEKSQQQYILHSIDKTGTWTWFRFTLLLHNWTKFCCVRFASLKICLGVFFCKLFASPMFLLYRSSVCMYFFGILFCFASCQTNWMKQNSNEEKVYSFTFCHKLKQIFQFVLETWAISKW